MLMQGHSTATLKPLTYIVNQLVIRSELTVEFMMFAPMQRTAKPRVCPPVRDAHVAPQAPAGAGYFPAWRALASASAWAISSGVRRE